MDPNTPHSPNPPFVPTPQPAPQPVQFAHPVPAAYTGTWGESIETRLAFVEAVISAGHAVGQRPGTAPTTQHITDLRSAKDASTDPKPPAATVHATPTTPVK